MAGIILRVFSAAGRIRLEDVPPDALVEVVIEKAAEKLNCEATNLVLRKEANGPPLDKGKTLISLGIANGQILHATTEGAAEMTVSAQKTGKMDALNLSDLPPEEKTEAGNDSPTSEIRRPENPEDEKASEEGTGGSKAHFKAFDAWLKLSTYETGSLPLLQNYKPRQLVKGTMFKVPPSITLKHQAYRHVDHVELMNVNAITNFVKFWRVEKDMMTQRVGILYGYYSEYEHYERGIKAVVEAIYEPIQCGTLDQIDFDVENVDLEVPDAIAAGMGLERVGLILTHLPRDKIALSAHEALICARWGLRNLHDTHYTGYNHSTQVVVTISLDPDHGDPVPNAFMISDLGLAMTRDGLIDGPDIDPRRLRVQQSSSDVLVSELLESGKAVKDYEEENLRNTFDVDWLIVRLNDSAPLQVRSVIPKTAFPVTNRAPIKTSHATRFLKGANRSWNSVADWNFLLWVARELGIETATTLADAVKHRKEVPEELWNKISSFCKSS